MSAEFDSTNINNIQDCSNFIPMPLCYQETEYTCGVTCTQSILARYGIHYSQTALADILHSQPILGTDYETILYFMRLLGFKSSMSEKLEIDDICKYIDAGVTPILIIQAWKDDEIQYIYDWKNAHYVIACGYYDDGLYIMDPYTLGNYTYLPNNELINRWHAVDKSGIRHLRSALIIQSEGCPVKYKPNVMKHLK